MGWTVCSLPALSEREPVASMRRPEQHGMEGVWAHLGTLVVEPPPLNIAACQISKVPRGPEGGIARPSCRASGRVSSRLRRSPSDFNVTKPHGQLARRAHSMAMQHHRKKTKPSAFHQARRLSLVPRLNPGRPQTGRNPGSNQSCPSQPPKE